MRFEDVQGERVCVKLAYDGQIMRGIVVGGDGFSVFLDVEEDDTLKRYQITKGQIVWLMKEGPKS